MTEQKRRDILVECVKRFGRQEWFRDATVYEQHPISGAPTIEIKCNYRPILGPDRKAVIDFAQECNLQERYLVVDKQGKPVE